MSEGVGVETRRKSWCHGVAIITEWCYRSRLCYGRVCCEEGGERGGLRG